MRRWRGNHPAPLDGASSRKGARPQPAASEDVQFVPVLTSFARRARMLRQASARTCSRQAVRVGAAHPRAASAGAVSIRREPSGRACPSLISELASHEVPGFGAPALPSALGLEALASALAIARDQGVSAFRPGGGEPSSAPAAACWRPSAETWPSLPVQRHPRGSNRVGEEGRVNEELSESPGQRHVRLGVRLSRSAPADRLHSST
jgi:hypothetical protein